MTYKEFKDRVEAFGIFKVVDTGEGYSEIYYDAMYEEEDYLIGSVSHDQVCTMSIIAEDESDTKVVKLMLEYVLTPLEERFPEKLYYLRLNLPETLKDEPQFYTKVISTTGQGYALGDAKETTCSGLVFRKLFTAEEVEEITRNEDMSSFSIVLPEEVEAEKEERKMNWEEIFE